MWYPSNSIRQKRMGGRSLALMVWLSWAILSGCMVGPNFQRPPTPLPADWAGPTTESPPVTPAEAELARWWTLFDDPMLVRNNFV